MTPTQANVMIALLASLCGFTIALTFTDSWLFWPGVVVHLVGLPVALGFALWPGFKIRLDRLAFRLGGGSL